MILKEETLSNLENSRQIYIRNRRIYGGQIEPRSTQKQQLVEKAFKILEHDSISQGLGVVCVCKNGKCVDFLLPKLKHFGFGFFSNFKLVEELKCQRCPNKELSGRKMVMLGIYFHSCAMKVDILCVEMKIPNPVEFDTLGGSIWRFGGVKSFGIEGTVFQLLDKLVEFRIYRDRKVPLDARYLNPVQEIKERIYSRRELK